MYHDFVMRWVLLCVRAILGLAEAVSTLESQVDAKASGDDLSTLQSQLDTKAAIDDLTALQTVVNTLPTAENVATKAATRDVSALQAQHAINSATITALESHGSDHPSPRPNHQTRHQHRRSPVRIQELIPRDSAVALP